MQAQNYSGVIYFASLPKFPWQGLKMHRHKGKMWSYKGWGITAIIPYILSSRKEEVICIMQLFQTDKLQEYNHWVVIY